MPANVPYIVGATFHRDVQMWPMVLQANLIDYGFSPADYAIYWAKEITEEQIIALYWRVRKWTMTGTFAVQETRTPSGGSPISASGSATISAAIASQTGTIAGGPATIEAQLLNSSGSLNPPASGFRYLANSLPQFLPSGESVSTWSVIGPFSTVSGIVHDGDSFVAVGTSSFQTPRFVPFVFDPASTTFTPTWIGPGPLIASNNILNQILFALAQPARNPVSATSGTGAATLKAPGSLTIDFAGIAPNFVVPLQLEWRFYFQAPTDAFTGSGSLNLTMLATEFWPYTNTLGEPIYDVTTGVATGNDPLA